MAEEYILLKDLNKAAKEFDLDKTTMNIISIEVPTHSFESLDEEKIIPVIRAIATIPISRKEIFKEGMPRELTATEFMAYSDRTTKQLKEDFIKKIAQSICQHFKKAEGDYVFSSSVSSDIYGDSFIYLPEDVNNLEYKDVIVSLEIQVLDKKVK